MPYNINKTYIECYECNKKVWFRKAKRIKDKYYCYLCWKNIITLIPFYLIDYSDIQEIKLKPKIIKDNEK